MTFRFARYSLLLICAVFLSGQPLPPEEQVRQILLSQQEAWNRGDVQAFMAGYEESPETTFIGKNVVRGYDKVLERYRKTYSTKERMGRLEFDNLEIRMLSPEYASVIGKFHLDREEADGGPASGLFTLLVRRTAKGWKIILDHTS